MVKQTRELTKKELKALPLVLDIFSTFGLEEEYLRSLVEENNKLVKKVSDLEARVTQLTETANKNFEHFDEQLKIVGGNKKKSFDEKEETFNNNVEVDEDASK